MTRCGKLLISASISLPVPDPVPEMQRPWHGPRQRPAQRPCQWQRQSGHGHRARVRPSGTGSGSDADTDTDADAGSHPCDDIRVSDESHIQFFEFKARKFCTWFEVTSATGRYDGIRATHVVSGLVASAAKLMRIRLAGMPQDPETAGLRTPPPKTVTGTFPVECRADWAEICDHRQRTGGLPGCLAEVQRELHIGLEILDEGRPYEAISHWQLGYVHNWGELAICALMMMHSDLAKSARS